MAMQELALNVLLAFCAAVTTVPVQLLDTSTAVLYMNVLVTCHRIWSASHCSIRLVIRCCSSWTSSHPACSSHTRRCVI